MKIENFSNTRFIVSTIAMYHFLLFFYALYTMFADYSGWTFHHLYPFIILLYSIVWLLITLQYRIATLAYIMLFLVEISSKLFFRGTDFGNVIGNSFFPHSLIFSLVIIILYKSHFGNRSAA